MYLSTVACCFYSTVLFTETKISLRWEDILGISKEKTAFVIPNAIQISTKNAKYIFTTTNFMDTFSRKKCQEQKVAMKEEKKIIQCTLQASTPLPKMSSKNFNGAPEFAFSLKNVSCGVAATETFKFN